MHSSQRALDLVVGFEVGGVSGYAAQGEHPCWPGGMSGVTWGIGYDGGYETAERILTDWRFLLGEEHAVRLAQVAGVRGATAGRLFHSVADITIPLRAAMSAFRAQDVPRYEELVIEAFPTAAELPPDCFGALFSLVFNRGPGMADDPNDAQERRREMREIRACSLAHNWLPVPELIRDMVRLWSNGLIDRRTQEAWLFEQGMTAWIEAGKPVQPGGTNDV